MQRLGGGGYTRKNKRGGGVAGPLHPANPSCGCDMQAGWPKSLVENIPLPSVGPTQPTTQQGGGTCGAPPIPRFYGGSHPSNQRGGSCAACSGLALPTPMTQQGGGQPAAYNSNPVPDACPFPGTGYCGFYARGGSSQVMNANASPEALTKSGRLVTAGELKSLLALYQRMPKKSQTNPKYNQYIKVVNALKREGVNPIDEAAVIRRIEESGSQNNLMATFNTPGAVNLGGTAQQGGANYGEPMFLQAKLRGGSHYSGYEYDYNYQHANENTKRIMRRAYADMARRENERRAAPAAPAAAGPSEFSLLLERRKASQEEKAREQAAREQAAREQAAREQAAREQAAREKAAREQAAKEKAEREELLKSAKVQKPVKTNIQGTSTTTTVQQEGGANYGEPMSLQAKLRGGACGCGLPRGGYRPTKKNLTALKKLRKGQSIGFTMTSSLKAKGLLPRTSKKNRGKKVVSAKYK
jgi:hypothetical protein